MNWGRLFKIVPRLATHKRRCFSTIISDRTEDALFDSLAEDGGVSVNKFIDSLASTGILKTDPRLKESLDQLRQIWRSQQSVGTMEALILDKKQFQQVVRGDLALISRALRQQFVIPDFAGFCKDVEEIYWKCKSIDSGKCASYIPQLARVDPSLWGVSICSVDGQRYSVGDTRVPFTIQSSGKPINYAIALEHLGSETVHSYVGQEPSGRMFNELLLDQDKKPHNPMVNAGAILICSLLLTLVQPRMFMSEKFDWILQQYRAMAGGESPGFSNATFLSEREVADRNYAIAYYMREHRCFPSNSVLRDVLDFYFQLCSLEVTCDQAAVMASTLANGGICPVTNEKVLDSQAVRDVLSLMHSCGMYDYSGKFAFSIGLPAKSGVSGCLIVVIPNVLGLSTWSPPLDTFGNSVRGVQFCSHLVNKFNFHQYDNLRHVPHKKDPRRPRMESHALSVVSLLFSAASGDVASLRRAYLSGVDINMSDYDGRTALHLAASEGHSAAISFLLEVCGADASVQDRWGHTPSDEAKASGQLHVVDLLNNWTNRRVSQASSAQSTEDESYEEPKQSVALAAQSTSSGSQRVTEDNVNNHNTSNRDK